MTCANPFQKYCLFLLVSVPENESLCTPYHLPLMPSGTLSDASLEHFSSDNGVAPEIIWAGKPALCVHSSYDLIPCQILGLQLSRYEARQFLVLFRVATWVELLKWLFLPVTLLDCWCLNQADHVVEWNAFGPSAVRWPRSCGRWLLAAVSEWSSVWVAKCMNVAVLP